MHKKKTFILLIIFAVMLIGASNDAIAQRRTRPGAISKPSAADQVETEIPFNKKYKEGYDQLYFGKIYYSMGDAKITAGYIQISLYPSKNKPGAPLTNYELSFSIDDKFRSLIPALYSKGTLKAIKQNGIYKVQLIESSGQIFATLFTDPNFTELDGSDQIGDFSISFFLKYDIYQANNDDE
jgi:hypothetical protein